MFNYDEWDGEGVECTRHSGQSDATYITSETDNQFASRVTKEHAISDSITNSMHEHPHGLNTTQDSLSNIGKGWRKAMAESYTF